MELSNEIKKQISFQYFGQQYRYKNEFGTFGGIIGNDESLHHFPKHISSDSFRIILKPLISITDEEAIEMAKIFGGVDGEIILNRPTDLKNDDIHFSVQVYRNVPDFKSYSTPKYWIDGYGIEAYQWLQSKGYDLPHYLLGGKTLQESGLAIYKK